MVSFQFKNSIIFTPNFHVALVPRAFLGIHVFPKKKNREEVEKIHTTHKLTQLWQQLKHNNKNKNKKNNNNNATDDNNYECDLSVGKAIASASVVVMYLKCPLFIV